MPATVPKKGLRTTMRQYVVCQLYDDKRMATLLLEAARTVGAQSRVRIGAGADQAVLNAPFIFPYKWYTT
jgi:hypothetical protein